MTELQQAIINELSGRAKLADDLYICVSATLFREHSQKANELGIHIAPAEGGAWKFVGLITVNEDHTTITLTTVYGIVRHTGKKETRRYDHCDPEYPQNLKELITAAIHNANRAYNLSNNRMWTRYSRKLRQA